MLTTRIGCTTNDENSRIINWRRLWDREFFKFKLHSKDERTYLKEKPLPTSPLSVTHPIPGCRPSTGPSELKRAWQRLPCISLVENQHWTSTGLCINEDPILAITIAVKWHHQFSATSSALSTPNCFLTMGMAESYCSLHLIILPLTISCIKIRLTILESFFIFNLYLL